MTTLTKVMTITLLISLAKAEATLTSQQCWGYGILAGFGVSSIGFLAAILVICFQRCVSEACFKIFVGMLYALACGAIIGDAMIHIMPEAFTNEFTNPRYVSLIFICAIAFFIFLERIFKSCGIVHEHWGDQHSHNEQPKTIAVVPITTTQIQSSQKKPPNEEVNKTATKISLGQDVIEEEKKKSCLENLKGKGSAGYLNLLSSFVHNFFDGLGIGIGFASGDTKTIIPIVIAIVAHEIPRQMGDVGILLKNGFSNIQTILCNGFINFMSLFGVIAGLGLGTIDEAAQNYVLVFVAGNFIYIGSDIWRHLLNNKRFILNLAEVLMFSIGVGAMFLVLVFEAGEGEAEEE